MANNTGLTAGQLYVISHGVFGSPGVGATTAPSTPVTIHPSGVEPGTPTGPIGPAQNPTGATTTATAAGDTTDSTASEIAALGSLFTSAFAGAGGGGGALTDTSTEPTTYTATPETDESGTPAATGPNWTVLLALAALGGVGYLVYRHFHKARA